MAAAGKTLTVDDKDYWPGKTLHGLCHRNGDLNWQPLPVGNYIGGGGSAHVYAIDLNSNPRLLAKIFVSAMRHRVRTLSNDTERLIPLVLARDTIHESLPFATWPRRLLFEKNSITDANDFKASLLGYAMTRLAGVMSLDDIVSLANKRVRLTRQNAKSIALSLVSQLDALHSHPMRFVFGDFNPQNIQISHDYKSVIFIDTDAFQFIAKKDPSSTTYDRPYYVPGINMNYCSPDTVDFKEQTLLSKDHDLYVLAIHLFRLVMAEVGVLESHPFVVAGGRSLPDLVKNREFPYLNPTGYKISKFARDAYANDGTGRPVHFNGHESIISVGGPGSSKTTAQVIPNLLTYRGSAIVLDVKGELWEKTAAKRATLGPVYRFSPASPDNRSDRYNPFDFISLTPDVTVIDCLAISNEIIPDAPHAKDPYWINKAREYLWALTVAMSLGQPPDKRNFTTLADMFAINTSSQTIDPETQVLIDNLRQLGRQHKVPKLIHAATALQNGLESDDRLESVLDVARSNLSRFAIGGLAAKASSGSDWSPRDLRKHRGTTVYLCIPTADLESFTAFLRLMFYQHMRLLLDTQVKPDDIPITFFLDELPQLGNFRSILQLQETGRGSGLRLWMLVQNIAQLRAAYGRDRGQAITQDARVRCYLRPDEDMAELLSKRLGETRNIYTGQREPLATPQQLAGPEYAGKMIVLSAESHPMVLLRKRYFEFPELERMVRPPPLVKRL